MVTITISKGEYYELIDYKKKYQEHKVEAKKRYDEKRIILEREYHERVIKTVNWHLRNIQDTYNQCYLENVRLLKQIQEFNKFKVLPWYKKLFYIVKN